MADSNDLASELLTLARDDLVAAEALAAAAEVADASVGFHCQQAVEKSLKAVLAANDVEFPYTHNVGLLIRLVEDLDVEVPDSMADADLLTPYGVLLRYGQRSGGTLERADAVEFARIALAWARQQLDG